MSLTLKVFLNDGVRRVTVGSDVYGDIESLKRKVASLLGDSLPPAFALRWKDDDGDLLVLNNDQDLREAVSASKGVLRVYVASVPATTNGTTTTTKTSSIATPATPKPATSPSPASSSSSSSTTTTTTTTTTTAQQGPARGCPYVPRPLASTTDHGSPAQKHTGVVCDGCGGSIEGSRFKCTVCPDFDLCSTCESIGMHAVHDMIRIRTPRARFVRASGCTRDPTPDELITHIQQSCSQWIPAVTQAIPSVVEAINRCAASVQHCCAPTTTVTTSTPSGVPQVDVSVDDCYDDGFSHCPAQSQGVDDVTRYGTELASLAEMGFSDTHELIPLLRKHNGNVARVVSDLFARRS